MVVIKLPEEDVIKPLNFFPTTCDNISFIECCRTPPQHDAQEIISISHLIVVVVGFVDTLVEVNETDGNATLNVSISSPLPMPGVPALQIMFTLRVDSMDGSAGRDGILQCCKCVLCTLISRFSN